METFRLVPRTHTNALETARTERSLFLADTWIFCLLLCFVFAASRMEMLFPFNLQPTSPMDFVAVFKTYGAYIKNITDAIFKILQSKPGASIFKLGQCLRVKNVGI